MGEASVDVSAPSDLEEFAPAAVRTGRAVLAFLGEQDVELSVALVDDARMQQLNQQFRGKDRTTDVLAFSQRDGEALGETALLGDVVISIPTARRQAQERGHSVTVEVRELLVHGILHLLGYDHEISEAEAERMFTRQREVLAALRLLE